MKKLVSLFLSAAIVSGAVPGVFADNSINYSYSVPNTEIYSGRNNIGVNQETITVAFDGAPSQSGLEKVTFTDSKGNEPIGGVIKTVEGNNLLLNFGELSENETYTLTIPAEIGISAKKTITFKTVKKIMVEEDFEDWELGASKTTGTGYLSFSENSDLWMRKADATATLVVKETDDGDKYLEAKNANKSKDLMIGTQTTGNVDSPMIDYKAVSVIEFRETNGKVNPMNAIGGWWGWEFGGQSDEGIRQEHLKNFSKNENGFFEVMVITNNHGAVENPSNTKQAKFTMQITADDLLSDEIYEKKSTKSLNKSDAKTTNIGIVKMYQSDVSEVIDLAYVKSGYFTLPKILGEAKYDGDSYTMTFTLNTDIDEKTLKDAITVTDNVNEYAFDTWYKADERKVSITVNDKIYDSYNYKVVIDGLVSEDGFEMSDEIEFTHKNENDIIISPAIEGNYSYDGETRTLEFFTNIELDEESAKTITVTDKRKDKDMPITASYNNKKVTIAINDKMYYGCEYEVILKGLKSQEGFAMKDNITIVHNNPADEMNFITFDHAIPNPKLRQTVKNGVETYVTYAQDIAVNQGYIKLVFDKNIDKSTVDEITFTDADGNAPKGKLLKTVDANVLTLEFGELIPETEYTVVIPETFRGENGSIMDDPVTVKYKTLKKLYIEEDFSDFETGSKNYSEVTGINDLGDNGLVFISDSKGDVTVTVAQTESGRKYINLTQNVNDKSLHVGWIPMGRQNSSTANITFVEGEFASIVEYARVVKGSGYNGNLGKFHHWLFSDGYSGTNANSVVSGFTKDNDGMYRVQVSSRKYDTEEVSVDSSGNVVYTTKYKNSAYDLLGSGTRLTNNYTKPNSKDNARIDTYSVAQLYTNEGSGDDHGHMGNGIRLAYVKSGVFTVPAIIGEPEYDVEKNEIRYYINTDLDESTVSGIVLTNLKNEQQVTANVFYDDEMRLITIKPSEQLTYQTDYSVDFTGVTSIDGFVMEEASEFRNLLTIEDITKSIKTSNDFEKAYIDVEFINDVMVKKDDVKILNADGEEVKFDLTLEGSKLCVEFENEFDYVNNYKLIVEKSIINIANPEVYFEADMEHEFVLDDIFSVKNVKYTKTASGVDCSAILANQMTDARVSVMATIAVFDSKGKLVASCFDEYGVAPADTESISHSFEGVEDAATVKVYALSINPELKTLYKETVKSVECWEGVK